MTAVMEAREAYKDLFAKKHGIKLGFMSFFAKAACLALKDVPAVNAKIEGDEIVYHDFVDISVAVTAPRRPRRAGGAQRRPDELRRRSRRRSPSTARRPRTAR